MLMMMSSMWVLPLCLKIGNDSAGGTGRKLCCVPRDGNTKDTKTTKDHEEALNRGEYGGHGERRGATAGVRGVLMTLSRVYLC